MTSSLTQPELRRHAPPRRTTRGADALPTRWPVAVRWFTWYGRRFVARNFHAVRVLNDAMPADPVGRPVLVCMNHPSWWDPMLALVAATCFFPRRRHFAPIDAAMLQKYRFFAKLGFFAVEPGSRRGAAQFLRAAEAVTAHADTALWVTAQGRFTDARARPVQLQPGLAHAAMRAERAVVLPMAVEYAFWGERYPEALIAFGEPLDPDRFRRVDADAWNGVVATALEAALDRLAEASIARDAAAFDTILGGSAGVGGVYDAWRRGKAWLRGRRFDPTHEGDPSNA